MLRFNQLLRLSTVAARTVSRHSVDSPRYVGLVNINGCALNSFNTRLYCKDNKCPPKEPENPRKKEQVDKPSPVKDEGCTKDPAPPKIQLKECKPVDILPCRPPCPEMESKIPPLNECAKPNLTTECPQPECEEEEKGNPYKTAILLGLLMAAATLGALYAIGFFGEKKEKEEEPPKTEKRKKKQKRVIVKDPKTSAEIPKEVPYLLIGGGTASFAAFRAIKSAEPTAKVLVITNESFHPYMRPPLSKEMWYNDDKEAVRKLIFKQWNGSERSLYYEPEDFYIKCKDLMTNENGGVAVARGFTVSHLDVVEKIAYLDDGYEIHYDKCLIAAGATPKNLTVFELAATVDAVVEEKVKLFRNVFDFEDVYETFDETKSVAIVGGGFLGSELACALARKGRNNKKEVYQVFRESGNMGKVLPEYLSLWTTDKVKAEGVDIVSDAEVIAAKSSDKKVVLVLNNGKTITVDQVVVAVGVEPNTCLAEKSDLEVDPELGGYIVNTELLARSSLYIAGDCACFYDARLGRRRVEHHDHAVVTGRLAGENMTGKANPYLHQSMFWSDLGPDVGYEAIGLVDSSLPTVGVFAKASDEDSPKGVVTQTDEGIRSKSEAKAKNNGSGDAKTKSKKEGEEKEDYGKGVVFYLKDDIVVGIVLWNVFNRMSVARQVLKDERKYDDLNEVAKLFNIHEE